MSETVLDGIRPEYLDLEWEVVYKNEEKLNQDYRKDTEKNFGDIKLDEVKEFWLKNQEGKRIFCVDIDVQALIIGNGIFKVEFPRDKNGKPVTGKLVYFRRTRNDFRPEGILTTVRYCIGLQANIDGINYQQFLFINNDGTFTLSQRK